MTGTQVTFIVTEALGGAAVAAIEYPGTELTDMQIIAAQAVSDELGTGIVPGQTTSTQTVTGNGTTYEWAVTPAAGTAIQPLHVVESGKDAQYSLSRVVDLAPSDIDYDDEYPIWYFRPPATIGRKPVLSSAATATVHYHLATSTETTVAAAIAHLPAQAHEAVALYTIWMLKHKDPSNDATDLNEAYQAYQQSLIRAKKRLSEGWVDAVPSMVDAVDSDRYTDEL